MKSSARRGLVALICATVAFGVVGVPSNAATTNEVGLVINHDAKPDRVKCVRINAESIRAFDLLDRSPYPFYTRKFGSLGRAACWLDGEGYFPGCFSDNFSDPFWGVWIRKAGEKQATLSEQGLSTLQVPKNGVLHMVFAASDPVTFNQPRPPTISVKTICGG